MIYIMRFWHPYQAWLLFFSRSPVTVLRIAQFWTMHHTKFQGLGDRHPPHCVWLSYTTTLKIHIRTYCILHITNVQVRSILLSYILHSTYLHHLTLTLQILEGPFSRILSIPALHPGLRWHPSRGHNLGDGVMTLRPYGCCWHPYQGHPLRIYDWLEYVSGIWVQENGISGLDSVIMPQVFVIRVCNYYLYIWCYTLIYVCIYIIIYNPNLKVETGVIYQKIILA